jgi:hypothetical protein
MVIGKVFHDGSWRYFMDSEQVGAKCRPPDDGDHVYEALAEGGWRRKGAPPDEGDTAEADAPEAGRTAQGEGAIVPEVPGLMISTVLKVTGLASIAVAVILVFLTGQFSVFVMGVAGLVGCFATAAVIDLLRIIAAKR